MVMNYMKYTVLHYGIEYLHWINEYYKLVINGPAMVNIYNDD